MFNYRLFCVATVLLATAVDPVTVSAQISANRIVQTGDMHISYIGADYKSYELVLVARDKVNLSIQVTMERQSSVNVYRYDFVYGTMGPGWQRVRSVDIPCPVNDNGLFMARPQNWRAWDERNRNGLSGCSFRNIGPPRLTPGVNLTGFAIQSSWLPGVAEARVLGRTDVPVIWSGEATPDDVSALVAEWRGARSGGSWRGVAVIAPLHAPAEFASVSGAIRIVADELARVCELGWITNSGVCNSLRTKLEQVGRALERGRNEAAVGQLQAFLNELEAQHGEEPGKHVNDNAYWLLKVNVEFILERMVAG